MNDNLAKKEMEKERAEAEMEIEIEERKMETNEGTIRNSASPVTSMLINPYPFWIRLEKEEGMPLTEDEQEKVAKTANRNYRMFVEMSRNGTIEESE